MPDLEQHDAVVFASYPVLVLIAILLYPFAKWAAKRRERRAIAAAMPEAWSR